MSEEKNRILTGDRPTNGSFHLGNYVGSLANRVRLQHDYDTFILLADYHVLTTRTGNLDQLEWNIRNLTLDYLSVGIDPKETTIYVQSLVPEVAELQLVFSMLTTVARLQRVPTLKDVLRDLQIQRPSLGLLAYPTLQAADILMVKGQLVPVGKDQASHIEVTREIARKFNELYGLVFPEPEALIGDVATLPGIDGQTKMGKSLGNAIFLTDDAKTVERKVMSMYTDPTRIHASDPGHVTGNPVFTYHDAFNSDKQQVADLKQRYRGGKVGDVEVKRLLLSALNSFLEPIRERRASYDAQKGLVEELLLHGSSRVRKEAVATLREVRDAMGIGYFNHRPG